MKYFHAFLLLMVLALALYASGCSGKPTQMLQLTEQSRQEAAAEHADQFAPDYWNMAEKSWQEASSKLDAQSWAEASNLLLKAKTNYVKARDMAKDRRTAAIAQINQWHTTATLRLKAFQDDPGVAKLAAARKKDFDVKVKEFQDNIAKAAEQLQNAQYTEANNLFQKTTRDIWESQQEFFKK